MKLFRIINPTFTKEGEKFRFDITLFFQGNDLYEADKVTFQEVRVKKQDTLRDVLKLFAVQTGHATER